MAKWFHFAKHSEEKIAPQTEAQKRLHRCAFTGHRPEKLSRSEYEVKQALRHAILDAIHDGFNVFITGMARGVDLWAAEIVLELRRKNKSLKLICAIPYEGFELHWSREWQTLYRSVLSQADLIRYIGKSYSASIFQQRNIWLVDHAARLIAVYNEEPGGTRNTIEYAARKNVQTIVIK